MKKLIALSAFLLIIVFTTHAQYNFAIGVRSGGTSGITLKSITSSHSAVEGIVGFWNDGLSVTGLYEQHPNAFDTPNLHWLFGVGAHATFYDARYRGPGDPAWYYEGPRAIDDGDLGLGIDAMVGLEYKIPQIPLAFSLEVKPFIEFTTANYIWLSLDPGLGVKLAF